MQHQLSLFFYVFPDPTNPPALTGMPSTPQSHSCRDSAPTKTPAKTGVGRRDKAGRSLEGELSRRRRETLSEVFRGDHQRHDWEPARPRELSGDSDRGVFASSCFAVIRNVDGSWFIGSNAQGGHDLYMFTGICVLLAALSQRPGVDRNGHLSTTASKLLRYVAPLVAAFAPRNARVGIIVVNAIPGEYHDAAVHLDYDPENLHGPVSPDVGLAWKQTR